MKTLLRIDSSVQTENSFSRRAADSVEHHWSNQNPNGKVIKRDLNLMLLPHFTSRMLQAFYNPEPNSAILQLSDELIEELKSCDELLLTSPVYNYAVPSTLKAYLDHIVRNGKTFSYDGNSRKGLLTNKKAYVVVARGGKSVNGNPPDQVEHYLEGILNYIGIQDVDTFTVYGTTMEGAEEELTRTLQQIASFFNNKTMAF